jgi:putative glutamine amidotransferase
MTSRAPIILVSMDYQEQNSRRGKVPTLTLTRNYADAILAAGGIPWLMPYTDNPQVIDVAVDKADGLLLSGGDFDIDPALFGEKPHPKLGTVVPQRTQLEKELLLRAEKRSIPILGICGGMQLMNIHRGGTLTQDIQSQIEQALEHQQTQTKDLPGHTVSIAPQSRLARITGMTEMGVNSTHHQAVKVPGKDLQVTAHAPDGVIEAIEDPLHFFYLGVQWHPEAMPDKPQKEIYQAFINACVSQN